MGYQATAGLSALWGRLTGPLAPALPLIGLALTGGAYGLYALAPRAGNSNGAALFPPPGAASSESSASASGGASSLSLFMAANSASGFSGASAGAASEALPAAAGAQLVFASGLSRLGAQNPCFEGQAASAAASFDAGSTAGAPAAAVRQAAAGAVSPVPIPSSGRMFSVW